ncbi:MAG TPA: HAD family phosphatase [Vicinamibacterales bacterium]|nr:HAD family phosphatase [Vicinamibacterales bacterium]
MIKAVLWDLDGTLVDSAEFHWQAWRDVMAEAGSPVTHEQFVHSFGKRNDLILSGWLGEGANPERMRQLSEEKESRFRALVRAHGIEPLPGVREWVARLHAEGWRQAIATSAPRLNLEALVDAMQMRQYFAADVAAEDVTHGKPDPEVFLLAASSLGADPGRAIVVEDAPTGIEAGRRAGMRTIGVSLMHTLPAADVYVRTLPDLPADTFAQLIKGVGSI